MEAIKTNIKEIFTSIQGEGLEIGKKHIFVRFCKCNLACKFCDTDFSLNNSLKISTQQLFEILLAQEAEIVSFTGGEPLVEVDFLEEFLKEYKNKLNKKIYLETNGTLFDELKRVVDFVDIVAMDIKIKSATEENNQFENNEKFLEVAKDKEKFIKVVFDKNIEDDEIIKICALSKKYSTEIILQPKMPLDSEIDLIKIFDKFYKNYKNIRLIPQTHKFLNLA